VYNTFPFLSFPFLVVAYSNKKAQLTSDTRATAVCVRRLVFATSTLFDAPSRGTPCDINAIYTSLKSTFSGLQFRRWQYETIFSCYCLRNTKNVAKFQENLTLQQFKVIQGHRFWCQWKAHITLAVSASVFEIFTLKDRKTADFTHPSLVSRPHSRNPQEFLDETYTATTRGIGLPYGENFIILTSTVFLTDSPMGRAIAYSALKTAGHILSSNTSNDAFSAKNVSFGVSAMKD